MAAAGIRHILCPFDLSQASAIAVAQAVACARATGARLTALHVLEPGQGEEEPSASYLEVLTEWLRVRTGGGPDSQAFTLVTPHGQPAQEIVSTAQTLAADLIVMGTHGFTGFDRGVLGSVTEKVLRKAPCPVLTVPPHSAPAFALDAPRVLCAIDFSDCSLAALELVLGGVLGGPARVTLLHVLEWPWHEPPAPAFDEIPQAEADALRAFRKRREDAARVRLEALEPEGFHGRCRSRVAHGRSYEEILRVAADEQPDFIALGVHGRNTLDLALFGSNAQQLVRRAECPVLTVRK
jgi:nucleotide-binding universal stress UspA family protein